MSKYPRHLFTIELHTGPPGAPCFVRHYNSPSNANMDIAYICRTGYFHKLCLYNNGKLLKTYHKDEIQTKTKPKPAAPASDFGNPLSLGV